MFSSLLDAVIHGDNILIPRPTWNYIFWLRGCGIEVQLYNLNPNENFSIDFDHLESLINERTKGIIVNNVGNPCGNVFNKSEILKLLEIAEKFKLPLICDDIYERMVFPGVEYFSIASLSKNVPIISCSGLTKRFLMPAARFGWIIIHDRNEIFKELEKGLQNVSGRNFLPASILQRALPDIFKNTPQKYFDETVKKIHMNAQAAFELLSDVPGIAPIMPKGSFFMMIKIHLEMFPNFNSAIEFFKALINEQNVQALPGEVFEFKGFIRLVITVPIDVLREGCRRIKEFCEDQVNNDEQ